MNFKTHILKLLLVLIPLMAFGQDRITGTFHSLAGQEIKLIGYSGFDTYTIDSTQVNNEGTFSLEFYEVDYGMGFLISEDEKSLVIVLAPNENLHLEGELLDVPSAINIQGAQNLLFDRYASEHARREQALKAWDYLAKKYAKDSLFIGRKHPIRAIEKETKRIKKEDVVFLESLGEDSFLNWYLTTRKLISSTAIIAQFRPEEAPDAIKAFRAMDYAKPALYKSGLLKQSLESHFWLLENSGSSLESVYEKIYVSIDSVIESLTSDKEKFNEIAEFLLNMFEKRSLVDASEYLALKILEEHADKITGNFLNRLEGYRAMKIGSTAPNFEFLGDVLLPKSFSTPSPNKLSDISTDYTVVVFGSGWCPACPQELIQIASFYPNWKKNGVEVVFVSLDEDENMFKKFAKPFPFISISDYQKWESPMVKDYHVYATPTMFLLDRNKKIILKPTSVIQLNTWIDWYLVQGRK